MSFPGRAGGLSDARRVVGVHSWWVSLMRPVGDREDEMGPFTGGRFRSQADPAPVRCRNFLRDGEA